MGTEPLAPLGAALSSTEFSALVTACSSWSSEVWSLMSVDFAAAPIRRTVFAMARQEILERLAGRPREAWAELLREWPGRHALDISSENGRTAAVYYAPNAGYQLERIEGKWTIVGG